MVRGDTGPKNRQRERGAVDAGAVFERGHAEDNCERVHQDTLIPAEFTGDQVEPEAEIEAPSGGDDRDERADGEPRSRIDGAHSLASRISGT